jgi:hypothetical protein
MLRFIRNTHTFAYVQGLYERLRWGDGFGRTHDSDLSWSEAYDSGANLADWLTRSA